MIARQWTGVARRERADAYVAHLEHETFPQLGAIPGFVRASILFRAVAEGVEFEIVTVWQSLDAIRAFAGDDAEVAVVPPFVQELMVRYDRRARHYEIAQVFEPGRG